MIVIDGRPIAFGNIVEDSEPVSVALSNSVCVISFNIINSPEHPIVLGLPWFELHNPNIDWINKRNYVSTISRIYLTQDFNHFATSIA